MRVRRLEPARTLDFVSAKDLSIGNYNKLRFLEKESARKRADMQYRRSILLIALLAATNDVIGNVEGIQFDAFDLFRVQLVGHLQL